MERPLVVNLVENRQFNLGEFEAKETTARLQHAISFGQRLVDMWNIANAERNRVSIEARIFKWQLFGTGFNKFEIVGKALLDRPFTTDAKHRAIDIKNGDMGLTTGSLHNAESNIAGAACNVERGPAGALRWCQPCDHRIFPNAVHARRHEIVHHVVLAGDLMENVVDQTLLFAFVNRLEAE